MKNLISALLISTVILSGCAEFRPEPKTSSPIETNLNSDTSDNQREETMFLNKNIGWKSVYHFQGMSHEDMELYKTINGGKTWKEIANSEQVGSTLPGGVKSGFTFVNEKEGWISANAPWEGKVGLFKTNDGGVTWNEQMVKVPSVLERAQIFAYPPLFFTKQKGILITRPDTKEHTLLYVTSDGGQNWESFIDDTNDQYLGIAWTLSKGIATVKYDEKTWAISIQDLGKWSLQP